MKNKTAGAPLLRRNCLTMLVASCFTAAQAAPSAPQVVHGQATFQQQGNVFSITNTPGAIINWQSFSVNQGEITRFIQQGADSAVLNRIVGQDPSRILGALQSNGRVFLINPNGILFGKDARVDVGALVASSLQMSDADFLAGKQRFSGAGGSVSNQGAITTANGGHVFLIAPNVDNTGLITSPNGDVVLAAGHSVQLVDSGNPEVQVVVSAPDNAALNLGQVIAQGGRIGIYGALVNQRGRLNADSAVLGENGRIVLKASRDTLLEAGSVTSATGAGRGGEIQVLGQRVALSGDALVDASGQAGGGSVLVGGDFQGRNAAVQNAQQTVVGSGARLKADAIASGDGGKIIVWSDGFTRFGGQLSATGGAAAGNGGFAEVSGKGVLDFHGRADLRGAHGSTGTLLLDPFNLVIGSGSTTATSIPGTPFTYDAGSAPSILTPASLEAALATSSVDVTASGTITVSDAVTWNTASKLLLNAANGNADASGIALDNTITNTGGGSLILKAGAGDITQSAAIAVPQVAASAASGSVVLGHAANEITTIAAFAGGAVTVSSSVALNVGSVSDTAATPLVLGGVTGSGAVALQAPYLGIAAAHAVNGASVALLADELSIAGNVTSSGATSIGTLTTGRDVQVAAGSTGAYLSLEAQDLGRISAGSLAIMAGSGDLTVSNGGVALADVGTLQLASTSGDVLLNAPVANSRAGGSVNVSAADGSIVVGAAGSVKATHASSGAVSLQANNMDLGGGAASISAPTGVTLSTYSAAGMMSLGAGAADETNMLGLSNTELNTVATGGFLSLHATGAISMAGALDLASLGLGNPFSLTSSTGITLGSALTTPGMLALNANSGNVAQLAGGAISAASLNVRGGAVALDQSSLNDVALLSGQSSSGAFAFKGSTGYSVGTVNGMAGIASAGSVGLVSQAALGIDAPVNSGSALAMTADTALAVNAAVSATGASTISLTSGNGNASGGMTLGGAVTAAGGNISLRNKVGDISQSAALGAANALVIADAGSVTLNHAGNNVATLAGYANASGGFSFTNSGTLDVGSALGSYGVLNFAGPVNLTALAGNLTVSDTTYGASATSVLSLSANAGQVSGAGIVKGATVSLASSGAITLDGVANQAGTLTAVQGGASGDINFVNSEALSLGTISNAASGGAVNLTAPGSIAVAAGQAVSANGNVSLDATGSGSTISNGGALSGATVSLAASKLALAGGSIAGTTAVALDGNGAAIEIGGAATDLQAGVLELSNAELNTITTPVLRIGGAAAGNITIASAQSGSAGGSLEHVSSALSLHSAGGITQAAGATIDGAASLKAVGASVSLAENNGTGTIAGQATSGDFLFASSSEVYLDTVDGLSGITVGSGNTIKLKSTANGISQAAGSAISAANGSLVLEAARAASLGNYGNNFQRLAGVLNQDSNVFPNPSTIYSTGTMDVATLLAMDGVTSLAGLASNNGDLKLGTGAVGGVLLVSSPVDAGTGTLELVTDQLTLGNGVTAGAARIRPHTAARPITVGSDTCAIGGAGGCLAVSNLYRVNAPAVTIGGRFSTQDAPGALHVAGISVGGTAASDRHANTVALNLGSAGAITQDGAIDVAALALSAGGNVTLLHAGNRIDTLAAETDAAHVSLKNSTSLNVAALSAFDGHIGGIVTNDGDAAITVAGGSTDELKISYDVRTGSGSASLDSSGSIYGNTDGNDLSAAVATLTARGTSTRAGAGAIDGANGLRTIVPRIASMTATGGAIHVRSSSALVVGPASPAGTTVADAGGKLTLSTPSGAAMTLNGNLRAAGDISLTAGSAASSDTGNVLTFNGTVTATGGNISIAGNRVAGTPPAAGGNVTYALAVAQPGNGNTQPSLAQCVANPTLAGCASVLPSIAVCAVAPTTAGCSAVLPSVAACVAAPTTPGCSAVLPSVAVCATAPATPGCSAVLPSVAVCTTAPTTPGCSAVLPSVAICTTAPTTPGCSAVLPSIAVCTTAPTTAGCSAVLPSVAICTAAPTTAGCAAVLPSVAVCAAAPATPGCSAVLPSVAICTVAPSTAGCSAVLPSVAICTTAPTTAGCSAVLPSLAVCTSAPSTAGCSAILPTLGTCTAAPNTAGCAAVLPSIAACAANPAAAGCSAVLPSLATCTTTPSAAGCAAVLPSLATCTSAPTTAGCSAVLPTLAECTSTPTLAGCATVLPPVNICLTNPTAPGCAVVLPPATNQTTEPVQQAINNTVNIVNTVATTVVAPAAPAFVSTPTKVTPPASAPAATATALAATSSAGPAAPAGGEAASPDKKEETKDGIKEEKKDEKVAEKSEAKNEPPPPKTFCN